MKITKSALAATLLTGAASAFSQAPSQLSSVTLYGIVDGGFYSRQLAGETRASRVDGGMLSTSRWGVRGNEDLGGGASAFFDLSSHFRLDTGEYGRNPGDSAAGRFFTRTSFVGVRSGIGQLRLGRIPTGSIVQSIVFSPYGDSTSFGPFMMHVFVGAQPMLAARSASDGIWNNSIEYTTPTFSGFTGSMQWAPSENSPDGRRLDATLNYRNGPFAAAASHARVKGASYAVPRTRSEPSGTPYAIEKDASTLASASYDFDGWKLSVQGARATLEPRAIAKISLATVGVNVSAPIGVGRAVAAWARTHREQVGTPDKTRNTFSGGYIYNLSKRTELYGLVIHDRLTGLDSGTGFTIGVRHFF